MITQVVAMIGSKNDNGVVPEALFLKAINHQPELGVDEAHAGMERFLPRLGVPDRCFELIDTVMRTCEHCNAFKPVPRRPRFGAELA